MINKAENLRRILRAEMPEWIPVECWFDPRGEGAYRLIPYTRAHAPSEGGYDLWGVAWKGTGEHLPYPIKHPATSLADALELTFPDIHQPALWQEPRARVEALSGDVVPIAWQPGLLWERFWFLLGLENALVSLVTEPDLAAAVMERIARWQIAAADHFMKIGMEVARLSDDYGSQNSLLMSPDTWRRVIRPQLARIVQHYQQMGLPVIMHSCGNLALIMDDLIELDFAAFNIQTNANDLAAYTRRYGRRFCLWGGVSTQDVLAYGTPEQIRQAVRQIVELMGRQGRLILEPDQLIGIPEANLQVFLQAGKEANYRA